MDRIEMFGNIAHNLVPRVEQRLKWLKNVRFPTLDFLVDQAYLSLKYMDEMHLLKEPKFHPTKDYMDEMAKLAEIAMSGHLYILGKETTASKVANQMVDTYKRKNADYGDSFGASLKKYGPVAAHVRMSDKINRLQSLVVRKQTAQVKDESIADTFLDLACYAIMRLVYIEMKSSELDEEKEAADE
jgi:hypothetical protein